MSRGNIRRQMKLLRAIGAHSGAGFIKGQRNTRMAQRCGIGLPVTGHNPAMNFLSMNLGRSRSGSNKRKRHGTTIRKELELLYRIRYRIKFKGADGPQ